MENIQQQIGWILQEKHHGKMTAAAKRDITRLKAGEPVDHIIGWMDFLGCKILANKNALIPRVETEFWTEKAVEDIYHKYTSLHKRSISVLDMFSGSGAIGIAIMRHVPKAKVTFSESEKEAVAQIKKNLRGKKATVLQSDLFEKVRGKFDVIVANPPYIPLRKRGKVQKSVTDYEPHAALFGGEDGLLLIRNFLVDAKSFLEKEGRIWMEFDSPQKPAIARILKQAHYKKWDFHRDQYGKWRYVVVQ